MVQAHDLYTPLLEGPVSQVSRHLPPWSCGGGGTGPGITWPVRLDIPSLLGLMTDR